MSINWPIFIGPRRFIGFGEVTTLWLCKSLRSVPARRSLSARIYNPIGSRSGPFEQFVRVRRRSGRLSDYPTGSFPRHLHVWYFGVPKTTSPSPRVSEYESLHTRCLNSFASVVTLQFCVYDPGWGTQRLSLPDPSQASWLKDCSWVHCNDDDQVCCVKLWVTISGNYKFLVLAPAVVTVVHLRTISTSESSRYSVQYLVLDEKWF